MEQPRIDRNQIYLVHCIARHLSAGARSRNFEELVATGLLGLAEARQNYRADGGASFRTLASIHIRGRIIDQMRRHQRWQRQLATQGMSEPEQRQRQEAGVPGDSDCFPSHQRTMESMLTRRELVDRLREAMQQLRRREREALRLHYLEGLETEEIARRWGCSRRAVNLVCRTARAHLRRLMGLRLEEALVVGI